MSNTGKLIGWDVSDLTDTTSAAVEFMVSNHTRILNIAATLCGYNFRTAMDDILEKGLMELENICEMDEAAERGEI